MASKLLNSKPDIFNPDEEYDGIGKTYSDEELLLFREGRRKTDDKPEVPATEGAFRLCIFMAQYMGMRSSEITQLAKDRIDISSGLIQLKKSDTKANSARNVPIHPQAKPLLIEQMDAYANSPYVFPNARDISRPMDVTDFKKPWNMAGSN